MKLLLVLSIAFFAQISFSQTPLTKHKVSESSPEWVKYMYGEDPNIYTLIELHDAFYATHEMVKNAHTQYYKRFVRYNIDFVDQHGNIQERPAKKTNKFQQKSPTSPWEEMGPWDYDHEQAMDFFVQSPGAAHVYTVEQSPAVSTTVFVGTANAGVWKSTDKGLNWILKTQDYDIQTVYSIALHPTDVNTILIGEGNGQIWKSTDGGDNWAVTGNASFQLNNKFVRDMKYVDATNVLAATSEGLFRSADGGLNWTSVNSGEHMEIEMNPGNSSIIYTVKLNGDRTEFYKSTDGGMSWTQTIAGWPLPVAGDEQKRVEIGVSADDPNRVYAWASGVEGVNSGFYGFYISNDAGDSFTFSCCGSGPGGTWTTTNPNMLGWSEDGTEDGGQFYYDLAFAASPSDADRVFGSGINVWRSVNNGADWELNGHWVTWAGQHTVDRYSHADVHDIKFFDTGSGVDMWVASDGGVFYSADEGDHLEPRMHGIHGTDFWGFGAGFKDGDVMVGGTYHNGTLIKYKDIYKGGLANPNEGGWLAELGGDNYRGDVNFGDATIGYADNGAFRFSEDRAVRMTGLPFDNSKNFNASYWVSENGSFGFDPTNYNHMYSPVGSILYESFDGGVSWTQLRDFPGGNVLEVHVSWANPEYIYVTQQVTGGNYQIQKSIDGGVNWSNANPTSAETGGNQNRAKAIALDPKDPNKLWVCLMGSFNGDKVFESTDGGSTWNSISSALINGENVISIHHQMGTDDGLYLGCYNGMFYRSDNTADWQDFSNNLPVNIENKFLTAFYGESKIRVAGNRGVYQCDFYEDAPPVAMMAANKRKLNLGGSCVIDSVQYVDHSSVDKTNATFSWFFEGGMPATSSLENPKVYYDTPGVYKTKLVVSDAFGTDSIEIVNFIEVTNVVPAADIVEDFNGSLFPPADWKLISDGNGSWERDYPENDVPNGVASFPNYWEDAAQSSQLLILPTQDFTQGMDNTLSFFYTYNNNGNAYTDSLAVVYRTGSNTEWQTLWQKGGAALNVGGTDVWFWYDADPSINWEYVELDLTALNGETCIEIAFSNIGMNGNHIWIDNVNLDASTHAGLNETDAVSFELYPNPAGDQLNVRSNTTIVKVELIDISGKVIRKLEGKNSKWLLMELNEVTTGAYLLKVETTEGIGVQKVIVK